MVLLTSGYRLAVEIGCMPSIILNGSATFLLLFTSLDSLVSLSWITVMTNLAAISSKGASLMLLKESA